MMTHIQFAQPHWLWIGALCCAVMMVLLTRGERLRRRAAAALAGTRFSSTVSGYRRLMKQALGLLGLAATFVALARPLAGFRFESERRDGIDLMFAVDTSKSMRATDVRPDRLSRAKLAVSDLVREFPGERVGLIAFAGEAFVEVPMTIDHAIFNEGLEALDTDIIPRGGTDIASPIRAAAAAMATEPDRRKLLVILSDGEDLQGEAQVAAKEAAAAGLVIYAVGVGTQAGDLIPTGRDGQGDVVRDADGQPVRSRLDDQALRRLAQTTGGAYAPLGPSGQGLGVLYRQHLIHLPRRTVEERMHKVYTERFQIPLAAAIVCLMLELVLGERRRGRADRAIARSATPDRREVGVRRGRPNEAAVAVAAVGLALLLGVVALPAAAASAPARSAAPATGVSTYNDGTTAYWKKDFAAARDRFQDATHTTDVGMQADAYYDLGDSRYRLGQASLSKDRPATMEAWKGAIAAYDGALALHPQDADARFNRELVARRLAALEEQERQDQRKDSRGGQSKDQDQGKQPQSSSGQGKGGGKGDGNGKNDQAQSGKGQPKSGQGPGQDSSGQGAQSHNPQGRGSGHQQAGEQGQGQAQTEEEGQSRGQNQPRDQQQNTGDARTADKPSAGSPLGASHERSVDPEGSTPHDSEVVAGRDARPDKEHTEPHRGPGVVSRPSGSSQGADQAADQAAGVRRAPGGLSASEAIQLLDSVSSELRRMPVASARRQQPVNRDGSPIKDW